MTQEQNQYQVILNIIGNIESDSYCFRAGKSAFEDWKIRALSSQNFGERIVLLIEADQQMVEKVKKKDGIKVEIKRKKWKFW